MKDLHHHLNYLGYRGKPLLPHRALRHFTCERSTIVGGIVLMAAHVLGYSLFYPALAKVWSSLLGFGLSMLGLPARVWRDPALAGSHYFSWMGVDMPAAAFTPLQGLAHAVLIAALVALSRWFKPHLMPLAYALRLLCGFHAVVIFYFLYSPIPFPYSVLQHTLNLFSFGAVMILLIPAILALTYYPLETSWARRTAGTLLIMLYFTIALPIQLLTHALLISWFGELSMPVLFLVLGPLLNTLAFVALYSWVLTWQARGPVPSSEGSSAPHSGSVEGITGKHL